MVNNDVVLSTRVRFARNIKDYPYKDRLDENAAKEIIERVKNALGDEYTAAGFESFDRNKSFSYVENHIVSREFAKMVLPHELFEKGDTKLMVCEEDHIRLQVIKKGFSLDECYTEALETDNKLLSSLKIDYNERLGYLTHCPTNLGTGMRVSVMLFLPALYKTKMLKSIISQSDKLGLTIRGMYGEGSGSGAYLYQISNRETLGVSEKEIISKLKHIVEQIITFERGEREEMKKKSGILLEDRISRALGTLKYAKLLSSEEFFELYAQLRLGVSLGIIDSVDTQTLDKLFSEVTPHTLCAFYNKEMNEGERDIARAEYIKNKLL